MARLAKPCETRGTVKVEKNFQALGHLGSGVKAQHLLGRRNVLNYEQNRQLSKTETTVPPVASASLAEPQRSPWEGCCQVRGAQLRAPSGLEEVAEPQRSWVGPAGAAGRPSEQLVRSCLVLAGEKSNP